MEFYVLILIIAVSGLFGVYYSYSRRKQMSEDARHIQHDRIGSLLTLGALAGAACASALAWVAIRDVSSPVLVAGLMLGSAIGIACIVALRKRAGLQ